MNRNRRYKALLFLLILLWTILAVCRGLSFHLRERLLRMETFGYFLQSSFYINLTGFLLILGLIGLAALVVYSRILRYDSLFRDFEFDESRITTSPLRVAVFTDNYLPFIGGVPISVQRLTKGLSQRGCAVMIFAPSYGNSHPQEEGVSIYRCRTFCRGKIKWFPISNVFCRELKEELARFRPDIVHVHHPYWLSSRGRQLARRSGVPVVFTYHTRHDKYVHNVPLPGTVVKKFLAHYLTKRFSNRCDAVIAPGLSTEEYLRRLGIFTMVATIPTGINIRDYSLWSHNEVQEYRQQYAAKDELLLICVCRLAREKNVDFMIDGLARVREKTAEPFRCIIVGDGPERSRLEERVADAGLGERVIFTGTMGQDEVIKAYLASDLFVFSSLTETQGMVLLEAMAGGCPVVAISASGVYDVVEDGFNGFKIPANINSWADSVVRLLEDRDLRRTLSENSREYAGKFSEEKITEVVLRLYHRVLLIKSG